MAACCAYYKPSLIIKSRTKMKTLTPIKITSDYVLGLAIMPVLVLIIAVSANAQSSRQTVDQSITWFSLNSNVKIARKWSAVVDGQFRFAQDLQNMQHMLRIGASYDITSKLSVVPVGYSYIWNYKYGKQPAGIVNNENRIWQQVFFKHKVRSVSVNHRLRLEERYIQNRKAANEGTPAYNAYSDNQFRVRYRVLANIPITKKVLEAKTVYVSIWDEAFVSWGKTVTYNDINQNRIFVGPGYQFTKGLSIQGGFFYQMLIKANGAKQENNTGALLQLNYNIDLTKKD
jgi:hypothetical protein